MSTHHPGSDEDRRLFADFVKRETKHPAAPDQPSGPHAIKADIMRISLESMRDHLALATGARRADGQTFRAYPAYVDSVKINAIAGAESGLHLLGVYVGLAAACYELANFCFAQGSLFPDIGDPSAEASPAPLPGTVPGFWMRGAGKRLDNAAFTARGRAYIPRDSAREHAALLLAILMLRAVWFHEMAHGLNGHAGWARRVHGLTCLHEVGHPDTARRDIPEAHLLEYEADQSALMMVCRVQIGEAENITGLLAMPLARRLHLTLFAAYLVTLILTEWARLFPFMVNAASHPPAIHRLTNQVRTVASNILPLSPAVKAANTAAFDDLRKLSAIVPVFPTVDTVVTDPDASALHDILNRAQDGLEQLRGHTMSFRYH
ncbi:hypothetical protein [Roseospira visakhapatnamensis]|uniref:Peptidase U49-like protein n=1 Tax=Roseospira visakhapatnamensis TaxID=390880 RepID=A0A7W6WBD5_9PROT|nr:hypothetical protein [Roseospira visakhapatnamensis]MBB4267904.1 hypothetical protein [Roseospira visakhapatnamensis]